MPLSQSVEGCLESGIGGAGLPQASLEANLAKLDKVCFFGCDEYTDLKKAVAEYKQRKGITS